MAPAHTGMKASASVGAGFHRGVIEQLVAGDLAAGGDRLGPALGQRADQRGRGRLGGAG